MPTKILVVAASLFTLCFLNATAFADAKLSEIEAKLRVAQIQDPRYDLSLDISKDDSSFDGRVQIAFTWLQSPKDLRIDFAEGKTRALALNGKTIDYRAEKDALFIPANALRPGANTLDISFSHPYSKDGGGLYRFQDPEDKRTYLYTQFETFEANRMFPNFDQPDLKGIFTLTVKAPLEWVVVSTTREEKVLEDRGTKTWSFAPTARISTYVFSLHAGPYRIWEDKSYRIPLRLMARQSLAAYVQAEEWLDWTRFGFDFFENAFGTAYPFGKFDQLIVPDFNAGAMENVAAVTYNERFLVRGERSRQAEKRHISTIFHEMAHMWFGDLVTMRWWDDLWLNESFATFAANWALSTHPRYQADAWVDAHGTKNWAYDADRLSTTHPIVAPVADTNGSNFDGITYGKGAAWIHLLAFRIGKEKFAAGLKQYFADHAFANATIADLIQALEGSQRGSLQTFAREWLQTKGLNIVEAEALCSGDKLQGIRLLQTGEPHVWRLREHSMMLSLFDKPSANAKWEAKEKLKIDYKGAETVWKSSVDRPCPYLLFPNAADQDYVKIKWRLEQWEILRRELEGLADPLHRALVWDSVSWSLESGKMKLDDVIVFVEEKLPKEKDYAVLLNSNSLLEYRLREFVLNFPETKRRKEIGARLSQVFQKILADSSHPKDIHLFALDRLIAFLGIAEDNAALAALYEQKSGTVSIDQPRRWAILMELAALRDPRVKAWAEKEKDGSDLSANHLRAIAARQATFTEKKRIVAETLKEGSKLTRNQVRTTFDNIFPIQQQAERLAFADDFRKALPKIRKHSVDYIRNAYILSLLPIACQSEDESLFTQLEKLALPANIQQRILEERDRDRLCRRIRDGIRPATGFLRQS